MTILRKDALEYLLYGIDEINNMEKLINEVFLYKKKKYNNLFLYQYHAENRLDHEDSYNNLFDSIRSSVPCDLISNVGLTTVDRCLNFSHNNLKEVNMLKPIKYIYYYNFLNKLLFFFFL